MNRHRSESPAIGSREGEAPAEPCVRARKRGSAGASPSHAGWFAVNSPGIGLLILLCGITLSCTPYSFSGGRTALVKSVAVPVFENETTQFGLAEALTKGIIDGLVEDNQVKVEDASIAEAVLNGRVLDYQRKAYTFDQNDQVKEYMVEINVAADLVKRDGTGSVWNAAAIRGFGTYGADTAETVGQERAIKKITEDIINRTVKSW